MAKPKKTTAADSTTNTKQNSSAQATALLISKQPGSNDWSVPAHIEDVPAAPSASTKWPTSTDICCFWCCHPFDSVPIPAPKHYNFKQKKWKVSGNFCSWSCAKAYMLERPSYQLASLLPLFRKQATGQAISDGIKAAPPRTALKMFGGPLSIDEFRSEAGNTQASYLELPANMVIDAPVLTLVPSITPKCQGMTLRPLNFDNLTPGIRNETLRLKRPKPVKNKANNNMLEKIFGIQPC